MVWPALTILALAALLILHLRWRRKLVRAQEQSRKEIRDLKDEHRREALQIQTQQEAVFNSMVEGLLLLDQSGRIRLANDAFAALFGVVADVRGERPADPPEQVRPLPRRPSEERRPGWRFGGL